MRYLRATAHRELDVEDLSAQVIEIAWRKRDTLEQLDELLPWLLAIAHNVVRNAHRGWRRRLRLAHRLEQTHGNDSHPSAHAELQRDEPGPARRALAALSSADREILVLHAWEDLDIAGIAHVLDISTAATAQRLHRARTRLAAAIESQEASDA